MSPLAQLFDFCCISYCSGYCISNKTVSRGKYSLFKNNLIKNTNSKLKTVEREKVVAEILNGRFAMIGLIAAIGAYLTTGQIIPGFV